MKHLKKFNESLELSKSEKRKILLSRGLCPVCESELEENSYGEDEAIYLECSEDNEHYRKYIGLADDMYE